ncbi:MAG: GNAT family N-acetyltransferase [Pseudomonadota bacterium]
MTPFPVEGEYERWQAVVALIHRSFAYMEPLLGHPAAAMDVTSERLAEAAAKGSAFLVEDAEVPIGCLFTRPSRDIAEALYLGWLAVDERHRGAGLARRLIDAAEAEARAKNYTFLTLDTGRALVGLVTYFERLGFVALPGDGAVVTFRKEII